MKERGRRARDKAGDIEATTGSHSPHFLQNLLRRVEKCLLELHPRRRRGRGGSLTHGSSVPLALPRNQRLQSPASILTVEQPWGRSEDACVPLLEAPLHEHSGSLQGTVSGWPGSEVERANVGQAPDCLLSR